MSTAIYPGSFDPLTNGHIDVIERSARMFERTIVAILTNPQKKPLFSVAERLQTLQNILKPRFANIEIDVFEGLLVDYAKKKNAQVIVRGVRAVTDFEYEFQMALMNRRLSPAVETVFMMPAESYSYLSSRLVKEIVQLGGNVKGLVPEEVEQQLITKLKGPAH